jgi:DNA-binding transcriptional regulator YiaG
VHVEPHEDFDRITAGLEAGQSNPARQMKICTQKFLTRSRAGSMLGFEEEEPMATRAEWQASSMDSKAAETVRTLRQLRDDLGLTQPELARLLGFSTRWVATQEANGARADAGAERQLVEIARLVEALSRVVQPESLRGWFTRPNRAFEGLKPLEVVERGQIDRLWQMIFFLESGVPS